MFYSMGFCKPRCLDDMGWFLTSDHSLKVEAWMIYASCTPFWFLDSGTLVFRLWGLYPKNGSKGVMRLHEVLALHTEVETCMLDTFGSGS